MDLEFMKTSNLTDLQCLMQLIAHLGLDGDMVPGVDGKIHHEGYTLRTDSGSVIYRNGTRIMLGCGGGDENTEIAFHFNSEGAIKEHYIFDRNIDHDGDD
jgi:hypothetical protein